MDENLEQYSEYWSALFIWKIFPPVFLFFGTFGNILTIVVLTRKRSRHSSIALYLSALACADLLVLYTGLLRQWIKYVFDVDVRHLSEPGCKIHVFLVYFSTQCSSWLLVAVTSERFIGVCIPHKVKRSCTPRNAVIVIGVIVGCLFFLNVHWFYGMGKSTIVYNNDTYILDCDTPYDNYYDFLDFTWPWIDFCILCLIPFTILVVGNVSMIAKVLISKHKTRTRIAPQHGTGVAVKGKDDKTSQLTAVLITLNVVFLVCVLPISIYLIGEPHWLETLETYQDEAVLELWWAVVNIFMYLNHTINFVLYFLSGSRFRNEVKTLIFGGSSRSIFGGMTTTRVTPAIATPLPSMATVSTVFPIAEAKAEVEI